MNESRSDHMVALPSCSLGMGLLFMTLAGVLTAGEPTPLTWQPLCEPGGGGAIVSVSPSPHDPRQLVAAGDMLGAATSLDGGDSWQPAFGFLSYEMCDITFHPRNPDVVWMGSCSGPYKSTDKGGSWISKRSGMPPLSDGGYSCIIGKVLVDPATPGRLLAFGGTARHWNESATFGWIWESRDDGENWKHVGTIADDGFSRDVKKGVNIWFATFEPGAPKSLHLLADRIGWCTSRDGGLTWTRRSPAGIRGEISGLTFHPTQAGVVFATTHNSEDGSGGRLPGGIYRSSDGGLHFSACDDSIPKTRGPADQENLTSWFNGIALSADNPDLLHVCDQAWNAATIYQSRDGGKSWRPVASRDGNPSAASGPVAKIETACFAGLTVRLVASPCDARRIYAFGTEYILRSTDGGLTWDDATAYRPDRERPDHWRGRGWNGWCATNFAFNPFREGQSIAQTMDAGRGWISDDGLRSWHYAAAGPNPWLCGQDASFSRDGHIYLSTGQFGENNGIGRSTDGGKTWTQLAGAAHSLPDAGWGSHGEYGGVHVHPENAKRVWVVFDKELFQSTNAGESWTKVPGVAGANYVCGDPNHPDRFFVKTNGGILQTDDGRSFRNLGLPGTAYRGRIHCDARGRVLVCQCREGRAGVWRYDPRDDSWSRLLDEHQAFECVADPTHPERLMLVTSMDPYHDIASGNGVWISHDDGRSWSAANRNLPMLRAQACAFNPFAPEELVIGTFGMGFFKARWPESLRPEGTRSYVCTDDDRKAALPLPAAPLVIGNGGMTQGTLKVGQWTGGARDTQVFKLGPSALRKDGAGDAGQRIDGHAGETIRLHGWMKTAGGAKAQVAVQSFADGFSNNQWQQLIYLQGDSDWTEFDREVTLPGWTVWSDLKLHVEGDGSAWLDEVGAGDGPVDPGQPVTADDEQQHSPPP